MDLSSLIFGKSFLQSINVIPLSTKTHPRLNSIKSSCRICQKSLNIMPPKHTLCKIAELS